MHFSSSLPLYCPGWVTFTLRGDLAYPSTGDVIDVQTRKIVARLTDEEGRYSLQTSVEQRQGAVVGPHTVTISTYEAEADRSRDFGRVIRKEEIPKRYFEPGALSFDVPEAGSNVELAWL